MTLGQYAADIYLFLHFIHLTDLYHYCEPGNDSKT